MARKKAKKNAPKLNPATDTPIIKTQLTKDFMLGFIKTKGTPEDKQWYKELIESNQTEKDNPFKKGEKINCLDMPKIRAAFAARFFPALAKTKKNAIQSYIDEVNAL